MPRIRWIMLHCGCGGAHKVRVERLADGKPLECCSCGAALDAQGFIEELELLHRYSEIVLKLEERFALEGDTVTPLPPKPSRKLVAV